MNLTSFDWSIIFAYFTISLAIGIWASRHAGQDTKSFFLAGRNMPWWLLGISMVATTFAADTPLAVTGIIAIHGISGNWIWWCFMLSGMMTAISAAPGSIRYCSRQPSSNGRTVCSSERFRAHSGTNCCPSLETKERTMKALTIVSVAALLLIGSTSSAAAQLKMSMAFLVICTYIR